MESSLPSPAQSARAAELRALLLYYGHRYYVLSAPLGTDSEYYSLYNELRAR